MYDAGTILNKVLDRLLIFFYPPYWDELKAIVSELTNSEALVTEDGLIIIQEV